MELKKFNDMQNYLVENIGNSKGAFRAFVKQDKEAERLELNEGGSTKPFYDKSTGHIYPRTNRFGTFYSNVPVGGSRRNLIDARGIGKEIIEKYKDGATTVDLAKEYNVDRETIRRYLENKKIKRRVSPPQKNQYDFDYGVVDRIREDAKTKSRKQILKKYKDKISDTKLDRLVKAGEVKFGVVEEAGRPRVPPGQIPEGTVKRTNRIRNSQGFAISGTQAKNFHHIFPIGGLADFSPQDVMILDKNINESLGGFNLRLNDIADEIGSMDLSSPDALKRLNDLNAESKSLVSRAKAKLPANMKNAIGYIEYSPVFDSNGTIIELSQIRRGVDKNPSALANFGNKKFKNFSDVEKKEFKNKVLELAKKAENKKMMLAAKIPGLTALGETIKSIPGDFAKARYIRGALKVFGIAMTPVMAYDAAKKFEEGKPVLEALEYGLIGTDLIGSTKRVLSLDPEEREARSVVKQDEMDTQIAEDFSGLDSDFAQPRIQTELKLEDAKEIFEKGKERVKSKEAKKNLERATKRSNFKQMIMDKLFPDPTQQIELAGGGIAKQAGVEEGPAPDAGPTPDGLPIDYNNVKKIKE
jgi:hypothetical protein